MHHKNMKYITLPIHQIIPNDENPRLIKQPKFLALVESMKTDKETYEARPIIVNMENKILGGNMRYRAGVEAGYKELMVGQADWPLEVQKRFIIKDNASSGEWDWDKLANEWDEKELNTWGVDIPAWADVNKTDEINQTNEWEGMPQFNLAPDSSKLIIQFDTNEEREKYVEERNIKINKKMASAWSTWYPERDRDDISSLKYEK